MSCLLFQKCFVNNFAVEEMHRTLGVAGISGVVSDHTYGRTLSMQLTQEIHYGFTISRIQVSCRFVGEKDCRLPAQRASHGDALLLTSGKLGRVVFDAVRHPDFLK